MKRKSLIALAVAAVVVVLLAVVAVQQRESETRPQAGAGKMFPDLLDKANAVASIKVVSKGQSFTITRDGEKWSVVEKSGYPAMFDMVKKTILGIAEIELLDAKTDKPERLATLELNDPDAAEGAATKVVLADESGAEQAAVLIGKMARGGRGRRYVRRPGEPQAWLARADLDVGAAPLDWIETTLTKLGRDRVHRVTVTPPGGEPVTVAREDPSNPMFTLADIPEGMKLTSVANVNAIGNALAALSMEDVRPVGEVSFDDPGATGARFETFDGLVVTVTLAQADGKTWARFAAAFDPTIVVAEAAKPNAKQEAGKKAEEKAGEKPAKEPGEETGEKTGEAAAKEPVDPTAAVRAEAEALNQRTAGWAYALPDFRVKQLTRKRADLIEVKKPKPETPPGEGVLPSRQ